MIDITKLTEVSKLAKELVEKGFAKDTDEAMRMAAGMSNFKDDGNFMASSKKNAAQDFQRESSQPIGEQTERFKQRVDRIEFYINDILTKYGQKLEELEQQVARMQTSINLIMRNSPPVRTEARTEVKETVRGVVQSSEPVQERPKKLDDSPARIKRRDEIDPSVYDINKIFDNSNSKMGKRI